MNTAVARQTTRMVVSYLASPRSPPADVQSLIALVRGTAEVASRLSAPDRLKRKTAADMAIARSITRDALISFEDGKPYKRLPRHLAARGLTPDEYRKKWNLPPDYPMISASYSAEISAKRRISARVWPAGFSISRSQG